MAKNISIKLSVNTKEAIDSIGSLSNEFGESLETLMDLEMALKELNAELKATQVGTQRFNELQSAIKNVEGEIQNVNQVNMGFVDKLAELPGIAGLVGSSIQGVKGAFDLLSKHPIIAAFTALFAIVQAGIKRLKQTEEGAAKLAGVMSAIQSALQPVMDAFAGIAEILIDALVPILEVLEPILEGVGWVFENVIGPAISLVVDLIMGLVNGIKAALKWIGVLSDEQDSAAASAAHHASKVTELEFAMKKADAESKKTLATIAELKAARDDETVSIERRMELSEQIYEMEQERIAKLITIQDGLIASTRVLLTLDSDNIELQEQLNKLIEDRANYEKQSAENDKENILAKNRIIRTELQGVKDIGSAHANLLTARKATEEEIYQAKRNSIGKQLALLKSRNATEFKEYKVLIQQLNVLDAERLSAIKARDKEAGRAFEDILTNSMTSVYDKEIALAKLSQERFVEDLKERGELTSNENALIAASEYELAQKILSIEKQRLSDTTKNFEVRQKLVYEEYQAKIENEYEANKRTIEFWAAERLANTTNAKEREDIQKVLTQELIGLDKEYSETRIVAIKNIGNQEMLLNNAEKEAALDKVKSAKEYADTIKYYQKEIVKAELEGNEEALNHFKEKLKQEEDSQQESANKRDLIKRQAQVRMLKIEQDTADAVHAIQMAAADSTGEMWETVLERWMGENAKYVQLAAESMSSAMDIFSEGFNNMIEATQRGIEQTYMDDVEALQASLVNRKITQEQFDQDMLLLDQQKRQKELQLKRKAFKADKANNIAQAVMQTALAVLAGLSTQPFLPMGPIMAAVAGGLGAVQIGMIASQKFTANRGGVVPGAPSKVDTVDAKLAAGEMVINSQTAQMFPNLLSELNMAGGGVPLAPQAPNRTREKTSVIFEDNRRAEPIQAFVTESNVTRVQRRVSRLERSAEY